ncbi:MAG: peptide chain release factor N(5)-glutamine methyltransferase [Clostridia bacterium]|nr:peptide chain release factor N(5)-glutamine methyltransferase [Clostridia bacterium]
MQSDLFDKIEGDFDVIVSNPPYVSKKDMEALSPVVKKEPYNALFGGVDGLDFYRRIIPQAPLKAGGKLVLEIGYDQGPAVKELMEQNGYQDVQVLPDLEGHDRIVLGSK